MLPRPVAKLFPLFLVLLTALPLGAVSEAEALARRIMESSDSLVRARLENLGHGLVEHRNDPIIHRRIVNYIERWPKTTGRILSRSARYFPIFEEQLAAAGMPLELKYIAIQESALRPYATSRVGAAGLWQLMPGTARELGLTVNSELDERLDAELGCAAGLEYLRRQYERYGDWALAIAAYNCGPGNVNKAIRRSGKRTPNFWQLRRHLPRETAGYMPSIIAAAYLMTYYHDHEVTAEQMELDMQITEAITVYRDLSLHRVAQVTGLHPEKVIELNPQYIKGYLPGSPGGHRLRLPARVVPAMRTYLATNPAGRAECDVDLPWASPRLHESEMNSDSYYAQYRALAYPGDTDLRQIAVRNGVPVDQLAIWSYAGVMDSLNTEGHFLFYRVAKHHPYDPRDRNTPSAPPLLANQPPAPNLTPLRKRNATQEARVQPVMVGEKRSLPARIQEWFK